MLSTPRWKSRFGAIQLLWPAKPICRSALTVGLLTAPQYNSAKLKSGKASMLRLSFPCDSLRNLQVGDLVQRRGQIIRARVERIRPAAECVDQGFAYFHCGLNLRDDDVFVGAMPVVITT